MGEKTKSQIYYENNKDYFKQRQKERRANMTPEEKEEERQKRKEYYIKNKEKVRECQKKYIKNNREKVNKMIQDYRKRAAEELKEQGQMYCYFPKAERERKMIEKLSNKKKISFEDAKNMLVENNWNIKSLLKG